MTDDDEPHGGGIVADSDWQAEYQESITKVKVLLQTLEAL